MPIGINGSGTITGISAGGLPDGSVSMADLAATGTPSASTYLRGDGAWASPDALTTGTIVADVAATKTGFLKCDGATYLRSSYPALATAIGTPVTFSSTSSLSSSVPGMNGAVSVANGVLFARGTGTGGLTGTYANALVYSTNNGASWNSVAAVSPRFNVAFGNGVYVTTNSSLSSGADLSVAYSSNLTTWAAVAPRSGNSVAGKATTSIVFGGTSNRFLYFSRGSATASVSYGFYSTNGSTWTTFTPPGTSTDVSYFDNGCVAASPSMFVLAYRNNNGVVSVYRSPDGAAWTAITTTFTSIDPDFDPLSASYVNDQFLIISRWPRKYWTSSDGISWTYGGTFGVEVDEYVGNVVWTGNVYVTASNNFAPKDQTGYFATSLAGPWYSVDLPGTVFGNNGSTVFSASGDLFYSKSSQGYTAATEFPVPNLTNPDTVGSNLVPNYFIKT